MKLKNVLLMSLSFVLVAAIAIGGTFAYLTSTDSDVNVMTTGNVKIEQFEMERVFDENGNVTGMQEYTQGQALMPAVVTNDSGNEAWAPNPGVDLYYGDYIEGAVGGNGTWQYLNNTMDKFVFVKNTGETDAYYRTIIACEAETTVKMTNDYGQDMIHLNINGHGNFDWVNLDDTTIENVEINGVKYNIISVVYKEVLKPGEISRPSLLQVGMDQIATNEYVAQFGDTYDILVLSQAVQTAGFDDAASALNTAFGEINALNVAEWFGGVAMPSLVNSVEELQAAIDAAVDGDTIILGADIEGDVTVTQKPNVKFTIDGNGKTIDGAITVDGKSKRYETAGVTIRNVKFASDNAAPAGYINLGVSGDSNTRYTNNVTVSNCTFDYSGEGDKAAIKSYTGGDYNLTAEGCTVNAGMHSFMQVTNIEKGLTITDCKVYSKNGINLNNTTYLNMSDCEFDTVGYCVRFGVNGNTTNGNFTIANSTLKSANDDGDAVIIFRGTMTGSTLNLKGTTLIGTPDITGSANIVK